MWDRREAAGIRSGASARAARAGCGAGARLSLPGSRAEISRDSQTAAAAIRGPKGIFVAGQVAAEIDEFDIAEALFQSLSASYSDKAELNYALARVQYRAGQFSESLVTLRRAVAASYETSEIYNLLGWCLYKKDDAKGAIAALDKAIALDPADESNYLDAGIILLHNHYFNIAAIAAETDSGSCSETRFADPLSDDVVRFSGAAVMASPNAPNHSTFQPSVYQICCKTFASAFACSGAVWDFRFSRFFA